MEAIQIKSFRRTSQSVFDLSFIDERLADVNGIVYCGRFPIINISTLGSELRKKLYPDVSTSYNWGLLNGKVYSKISEAEEALLPIAIEGGASLQDKVPDNPKDPLFVSLIPISSREVKCKWLGKFKKEMSDSARREAGLPPLKGDDLDSQVHEVVESLKRSQA